MEFTSLGDYTEQFFAAQKSALEKAYPGITLRRIKSELEGLASQSNMNPETIFEESYFPDGENEISKFFIELKKGRPLEYISNRSYFYHSEFYVDENVLIPRSETEILVEKSVEFAKKLSKSRECLNVCDIGTGSGAIVLSFIQELDCAVNAVATDICEDALVVARRNDFSLRFKYPKKSKINFIKTDRLIGIDEQFDIIMSNPPYIKEDSDKEGVHHQVEAYEPHLALYLKDSLYDTWFMDFFKQVESRLNNEGLFIMEGHEEHLQKQRKILETLNFKEVEVIQDYTGRDRFLKGIKNAKITS